MAEPTQHLQIVRVVHKYLVLLCIHDIDKPVFRVDGDTYRCIQLALDLIHNFVVLVQNQHAMQFAVGDKNSTIVVDGNSVDPSEAGLETIANKRGWINGV